MSFRRTGTTGYGGSRSQRGWRALGENDDRLKNLAARHGRWLTFAPDEVDTATAWFRRHCGTSVIISRLIPRVRTLISVPAGIAEMTLSRFLVYSGLGTAIWSGMLAGAGYRLEEQCQKAASYVNPASNVIFGLIVAWYVYRVVTFPPKEEH
jgi:membrane protein DedA with SNARE-associated domain